MQYDFDQVISRKGTDSAKWEYKDEDFRPMQDNPLSNDQILPLWVADMDFRSPQPVIDALIERAKHGVFGYTKAGDAYYDAIIDWMQRRHNWQVTRESILSGVGVVPSIDLIINTFTQPGDGILIQTPVYHPFYHSIENNGRVVVSNPLIERDASYDIDFADLEIKAANPNTTMAILCSPHNPIGRIWTAAELRRFAETCLENDVLIISDEIHHDLVYSWGDFTTFGVACPESMDRAIVCTAPSKTFNVPGLKTSNVFVINPDLREQLQATFTRLGVYGVNPFGAAALEAAYTSGEAWLERMMAYVEGNYCYLETYFAEHLPQVRVFRPDATYLVWTDWRQMGLDTETLNAKIYDGAGVYLNEGSGFGEAGTGFMRINVACPREILTTALDRIRQVMQPA